MKQGTWKGWEYTTPTGLHMIISKRHYFIGGNNQAVCGVVAPKFGTHKDEGEYACRKCENWCEKNDPKGLY